MPLTVRTITAGEHRAYVATHPRVALQQTPGWGRGFEDARTESLGWFDSGRLVGAGLVRYRGIPRLPMRTVAVFESGPDIDWTGVRRPDHQLADWTEPMVAHLRRAGAFSARVNPTVAERQWSAVDPAETASGKELVVWRPEPARWDCSRARRRLEDAGWSPMSTLPATFNAEVVMGAGLTRRQITGLAGAGSVLAGYTVRTGTAADLQPVHAAVTSAHPGIPHPSVAVLLRRWEALAADDPGAVKLLVVQRRGDTVYGGLVAVVGERAWDLSPALPQPDADRPEVQVLRTHVIAHAAMTGSAYLSVPTVLRHRRAPVRTPAPGWPPVRLQRTIGTWHYPVRETWHAALGPVVDRIPL